MKVNVFNKTEVSIIHFRGHSENEFKKLTLSEARDLDREHQKKLVECRMANFLKVVALVGELKIFLVNPSINTWHKSSLSLEELGGNLFPTSNDAMIAAAKQLMEKDYGNFLGGCNLFGDTELICDNKGNSVRKESVLAVKFSLPTNLIAIINFSDTWLPVGRHGERHDYAKANSYRLEKCMEGICNLGFDVDGLDEDTDGSARKKFRHYNSRSQLLREFPDDYESVKMFCWEDRSAADSTAQYGDDFPRLN